MMLFEAPSLTVKEMVDDPIAFVTGVTIRLQFGAVPVIAIPETATIEVLLEDFVIDEEQLSAVSVSLIEIGIIAVGIFTCVR